MYYIITTLEFTPRWLLAYGLWGRYPGWYNYLFIYLFEETWTI